MCSALLINDLENDDEDDEGEATRASKPKKPTNSTFSQAFKLRINFILSIKRHVGPSVVPFSALRHSNKIQYVLYSYGRIVSNTI